MEGKAAARIGDEQGTSALDFYAVREQPWSFGNDLARAAKPPNFEKEPRWSGVGGGVS